MNLRQLWIFLVFQVFATFWAIFSFRYFPVRFHAALSAGGCFLLLGLLMCTLGWRWPLKWRSPTYYLALVFTFGVAIPMLYVRLTKAGSFSEAMIFGLNGDQFHKLSEIVFTAMIGATVVDLIRAYRQKKM